jgi:hypothetical protein
MAFASVLLEAEQHAMSPEIRSDLMVYETADGPIWNGRDQIALAVFPCQFGAAGHAKLRVPHPSCLHRRIVNQADGAARQKPLN